MRLTWGDPCMNQKIKMLTQVSVVITFVVTTAIYFALPERIVAHQNLAGVVTRYGNRAEVFIVPIVIAMIKVLYIYFWRWTRSQAMKRYPGGGGRLNADKVTLISAITVASVFASISILVNSYTYATTNNEAFPLMLIGVVFCSMLSVLASLARGGNGWMFAILPLALLALGLLQTVHLGILTAIAVLYAIYCCYQLVCYVRLAQ